MIEFQFHEIANLHCHKCGDYSPKQGWQAAVIEKDGSVAYGVHSGCGYDSETKRAFSMLRVDCGMCFAFRDSQVGWNALLIFSKDWHSGKTIGYGVCGNCSGKLNKVKTLWERFYY